ncbi:MAG TPA: hypothetical protein VN670_00485 [Acidobacteriaceae bacterium]|nr:hypothetical protein [Acidobacteriaceae bacterium]
MNYTVAATLKIRRETFFDLRQIPLRGARQPEKCEVADKTGEIRI